MFYQLFTRCYMCFSPWTTIKTLIEMTNVSLQSFFSFFFFLLQVMKAPSLHKQQQRLRAHFKNDHKL